MLDNGEKICLIIQSSIAKYSIYMYIYVYILYVHIDITLLVIVSFQTNVLQFMQYKNHKMKKRLQIVTKIK